MPSYNNLQQQLLLIFWSSILLPPSIVVQIVEGHAVAYDEIVVCQDGHETITVSVFDLSSVMQGGATIGPCDCDGVWNARGECIDCNSCPSGVYNDGCNTCTCTISSSSPARQAPPPVASSSAFFFATTPKPPETVSSLSAACTNNLCLEQKEPFCVPTTTTTTTTTTHNSNSVTNDEQPEEPEETTTSDEEDDDTILVCQQDGTTTVKGVPVDDLPSWLMVGATFGECGCTNHGNYNIRGECFDCNTCRVSGRYYDGCNECTCDKATGMVVCTERACFTQGEPSCIATPTASTISSAAAAAAPTTTTTTTTTTAAAASTGTATSTTTATATTTTTTTTATTPIKTSESLPIIIDCTTCPQGYYDGCNECTCDSSNDNNNSDVVGGSSGGSCTERACGSEQLMGEPTCFNLDNNSDNGELVHANGHDSSGNTEPAEEVATTTIIDCTTCPQGYFDGCNECTCGSSAVSRSIGGGGSSCTERSCGSEQLGEPTCITTIDHNDGELGNGDDGDGSSSSTKPETITTIDCTTCPKGYYDGCNVCHCFGNGVVACTERDCGDDAAVAQEGGEQQEPSCLYLH